MSGEAQTGCGSTGCIIAAARVGAGKCSCLDGLTSEVRVALRSAIKSAGNLLAVIHGDGGHHLDAVGWVEACKDAEEAWIARVQCPDGPVSEHLRKRVAEVCQAALDGKAGCIGAACIAPHQAGDLLDAYDDARRERDEMLAWARELGCEMQADDLEDYTPAECSPSHSGRCWPCEAKVRADAEGEQP